MKAALFVLSLLTVFGVSENAAAAAADSEALTVAHAAGLKKLKDVTAKDLRKFNKQGGHSSLVFLAMGAATQTGMLPPPRGLSRESASMLGFSFAFLNSLPVSQPEAAPGALVWMPKSEASTAAEAARKLRELWVQAVQAALPQAQVRLQTRTTARAGDMQNYIEIVPSAGSTAALFGLFLEERMLPKEENAPDFLGGGPVYVWNRPGARGNGNFNGYPWSAADLTGEERLAFLLEVSRHLPAWVYLYLPPHNQLMPYPQILHQGTVLLFVDPAVEIKTAQNDAAGTAR